MKYDDYSWHYGGDFPDDLPDAAGATHIGMFLTWCLLNGLGASAHARRQLALVKRETTPGQWVIDQCDGKLTDEDLNDEGNAFARSYLRYEDEESTFFDDYFAAVDPGEERTSDYHIADDWDNYERFEPFLQKAFDEWKAGASDRVEPEDQLREIAESLAEVLRPRGYRFAKKGLSFSRRKAGFGFRIEFLLRREFVELLVEVNSTAMKAWRQEEGYIPVSPVVLFGPLNGLLQQDSYRWEVTRPSVAAQEMLSVIEREVEPIFELFSDLPRALEATKANRIPGWLRERRLDFILWCDER